jgi:hypothetical protein
MSDPINKALALYTSFGKARFPRARTADVAAEFGDAAAIELKSRIVALYDELKQPLPEPVGKGGRQSVTARAIEQVRARHPELDEHGLAVLAWTYSFGLR